MSFTIYAVTAPVVTVTAPTGTITAPNPNVTWTLVLPPGAAQATYRVIIYTPGQVATPGFVGGGGGPSVYDSGVVSSSLQSVAPPGLPAAGQFYPYVQVYDTPGTPSAWAVGALWTQAVAVSGSNPNAPALSVQLGFAPTALLGSNFVLNDPVKGILGGDGIHGLIYKLGGNVWTDVTTKCIGQLTISRGKSLETDQYTTGTCSFELYDPTRQFDPSNTASPYYPSVSPRCPVQVWLAGQLIFAGYVDDWNTTYSKPTWESVKVSCLDAFSLLASSYIGGGTAGTGLTVPQELPGSRLTRYLTQLPIALPPSFVDGQATLFDVGNTILQANVMGAGTVGSWSQGDVMLNDMQTVADSEWGHLYVDRMGHVVFHDRHWILANLEGPPAAVFTDVIGERITDGGAGFAYTDIGMLSSSVLLFNQISGTRNSGTSGPTPVPQEVADGASQTAYLNRALSLPSVENVSDADVLGLCAWVLSIYHLPEVRFDSLTVEMAGLTQAQVAQLASLDMGSACAVHRTPPGSGTPAVIGLSGTPATAWASGTAYVAGNQVGLGGVNYTCILGNTNHTPPNATYWLPVVCNTAIGQIGYSFDVTGQSYKVTLGFRASTQPNYLILADAARPMPSDFANSVISPDGVSGNVLAY